MGSTTSSSGRPFKAPFLTEQQLADLRDQCRALAVENEFAINGHENRISYLVGTGHTYRATAKKGVNAPQELWRAAQQVIDDFLFDNHWHRRQQEIVRRYDRDGEVFLRFFTNYDGKTKIRFVEPDQVACPRDRSGDAAASFGILTEPDDVETPLAYFIDGQPVDAADIQHRKANVDSNVKRGLPLFYPVRKNLRRAEKLLRNMTTVAEIQSAIALVRRHRGGTRAGVEQFVAGQTDVAVTSPATGQTTNYRRFAPGTILDSHGGIEYDFPVAGLDAGNYVQILQAELRAIASRLVMPEFMLTSDASNANYASTQVAEGPAMRMFARVQAEQIADDLAVLWRVLRNAVEAGQLEGEVLEAIEIQASPPTLSIRDGLKEAQTHRIEMASGILSPQTWSQRLGLDYDQEQANLRQHAAQAEGRRKAGVDSPNPTDAARLESLSEVRWDPSKHPRGGFPQNRGWFSPTSGSGASAGRAAFTQLSNELEPPRERPSGFSDLVYYPDRDKPEYSDLLLRPSDRSKDSFRLDDRASSVQLAAQEPVSNSGAKPTAAPHTTVYDSQGKVVVDPPKLWKGAIHVATAQGLPSFLLKWNSTNGTAVSNSGTGSTHEYAGGTIYYRDEVAIPKLLRVGGTGMFDGVQDRTSLGPLFNEAFHAWFHSARQGLSSAWLMHILDRQSQFGSQMRFKAEEAMSETIDATIQALEAGNQIPTYDEILQMKPSHNWRTAITPGHNEIGQRWHADPGSHEPMSEELYYATLWALYNGNANVLPHRRPGTPGASSPLIAGLDDGDVLGELKRFFAKTFRPTWTPQEVAEFTRPKP